MHLSMQVLLALLAVVIGAISYKASNITYSCFRNSRLLRVYPGPKYGFFLGVIPHFAGSTPLTRYASSTASSYSITPHSARYYDLQGDASLGGRIWACVSHAFIICACKLAPMLLPHSILACMLLGITKPLVLQALCVSDPTLATEILQIPKILDKNRQALVTLDLVRAELNSCKSQGCDTHYYVLLQMTSRHGELPSLVTNATTDVYWKAIRKGIAPAFSPANIRCATCI